jgi:hypothetical protein
LLNLARKPASFQKIPAILPKFPHRFKKIPKLCRNSRAISRKSRNLPKKLEPFPHNTGRSKNSSGLSPQPLILPKILTALSEKTSLQLKSQRAKKFDIKILHFIKVKVR